MVRLNKRRRSRSNRRSRRRNRNQRGGDWFNPMTWFGEKKEEKDNYENRSAMGGVDTLESSHSTETGSSDTFGSNEPSQFGGRRRRRRSRRRRKKSRKSRKKRHRRTKRKRRR